MILGVIYCVQQTLAQEYNDCSLLRQTAKSKGYQAYNSRHPPSYIYRTFCNASLILYSQYLTKKGRQFNCRSETPLANEMNDLLLSHCVMLVCK